MIVPGDKTGEALVNQTSRGVAGFFRARQIVKIAKAEAEASLIKTKSDIENAELRQRAVHEFEAREVWHQQNVDAIERMAEPLLLTDGANPEAVDEDWRANVFEKCRIVSDEEMQSLWARVIAGEVNTPGSFTRRTVNRIADLDKYDCELFTRLCRINVSIGDFTNPLIIDLDAAVYSEHGIESDLLAHLDSIGLIHFMAPNLEHTLSNLLRWPVSYFDRRFLLEMPGGLDTLPIGRARLTRVGRELAPISGATPIPAFLDYLLATWSHLLKPMPPDEGGAADPPHAR